MSNYGGLNNNDDASEEDNCTKCQKRSRRKLRRKEKRQREKRIKEFILNTDGLAKEGSKDFETRLNFDVVTVGKRSQKRNRSKKSLGIR